MAIPLTFPATGNLFRPGFDTVMVIWLPLIALATTLFVVAQPESRGLIIALDLWLLGYHHVIATFTRTAMDRDALRRYWPLNAVLPASIFSILLALAFSSTSSTLWITSLYIHWQLFHYVRQSEGIAKAYAGRGGRRPSVVTDPVCRAAFYITPITAFLTMAAKGQNQFLGFPVWLPRLDWTVIGAFWAVTALLCAMAARRIVASARKGELTPQHLAFLLSHYLVFVIAYAGIRDIVLSWLMANIWHNGQYLAFVWVQNHMRFDDRIHDRGRMLSTLCQQKNIVLYVAFCMSVTLALYYGAATLVPSIDLVTGLHGTAIAALIYQTINFHHYIVDAIIWRRPKAKATATPVPTLG